MDNGQSEQLLLYSLALEVELIAGSLEALATAAPRVLQRVRQCACACDKCDTLAKRLNAKLQLGKSLAYAAAAVDVIAT